MFIEYFEHIKKKIKIISYSVFFLFITDITWLRFNIGFRVKGIDLRVGRCMFSGFEGLE